MRANTRASQAASIQDMLDGARDRIIIPNVVHQDVPNIFARGLSSPDNLDPTEKIRFHMMLQENVLQLQNVLNLRNQKMLSEDDYRA